MALMYWFPRKTSSFSFSRRSSVLHCCATTVRKMAITVRPIMRASSRWPDSEEEDFTFSPLINGRKEMHWLCAGESPARQRGHHVPLARIRRCARIRAVGAGQLEGSVHKATGVRGELVPRGIEEHAEIRRRVLQVEDDHDTGDTIPFIVHRSGLDTDRIAAVPDSVAVYAACNDGCLAVVTG